MPNSLSASGMNLPSEDLRLFIRPIVGAIVTTVSPRSWNVVSLSSICSSAIRAFPSIFETLRTSANSFTNTLPVWTSCFCVAATILWNSFSSRWCSLVSMPSSFDIWPVRFFTAASMRGFRAPFGFIISLNFSEMVGVVGFDHEFWKLFMADFEQFVQIGRCEIYFTVMSRNPVLAGRSARSRHDVRKTH